MATAKAGIALLQASEFFDADEYLARYPDVRMLRIDPAEHYLRIGAKLMRDPSDKFDTGYYASSYPDVERAGLNPLLHYLEHGREEGRACLPPENVPAPQSRPVPQDISTKIETIAGSKYPLAGARTILVCAHMATSQLFGGERSLLDILDGFGGAGYNVIVAAPGFNNGDYLSAVQERCVAVVSFPYGWWSRGCGVDEAVVAQFCAVISEHAIDAVHANTIMLREPLIAARRMGVPGAVHARELIEHDAALLEHIGELPENVLQQVLDSADWIIANSGATAASLHKPGSTFVVPNTVDAKAFDIPIRGRSGTVHVGMLSSNLPKKGLADFVDVARLCEKVLPHARFLLMGPENEHTMLLKASQATGDAPRNIEFPGYFDDPAEAMERVDVILNLSYFQESFGRTVLEAMAARRPVIVYDWGALPELVVQAETGFVVPFRDVGAVAEKLSELCADPRRLRTMGEAARKRAVSLYDKPHYAARLEAAYDTILDTTDGGATKALTLPARNGSGVAGIVPAPRIAYFLWHFPVPSETFVLNELRILVGEGYDVRVFCRQSPHKDFAPDFPIEWEQVTDPANLAERLLSCGRTVVHSHFTYPTVTDMVWPACELAGIPFTFIAHAQDIFRYSNDERNRIGEIGRSESCLRVLVPSRFHREYVLERGVPAQKVLINPNGIDPQLYEAGRDESRVRRTRRSICAVHRFTEKKGLENLILAGKSLSKDGITINLYGYGDLEPRYRELIAAEQLDNVLIHGPVRDRAHMLEVFAQNDLFACPSVRAADGDMDGIPTVLMEAMASGLAVITTGVSGIPDLVRDGVTGIVCEADASSLAGGVRRFYSMSDGEVAAMVEEARSLIDRDYHVARLSHALLRLWQRDTIDIMIVSWNNLDELREVIRRLYEFTTAPFHLVICDNGSEADVTLFLCELYARSDNVTVVLNRENVMVGPGTNICLQHSSSKYAVYVCGKEGFVLNFGWERRLIDHMDAHPQTGLAGTLCHAPSYLFGRLYPKAIALFPKFRNTDFATDNPERVFAHVQGGFFIMRRSMYESIGGFSPAVAHAYTDVEYSYYAESMGWSLGRAPGLLALYNKTRPGIFTRIDESVGVIHPPTLGDLPLLDAISNRATRFCNLCGWNGPEFEVSATSAYACPSCSSGPTDRTLFRYLAESTLPFRRLPALGVGVGDPLATFWREQFLGELVSLDEFVSRLDAAEGATGLDGLKLVYLDVAGLAVRGVHAVLREAGRAIAADGVVLLRTTSEGIGVLTEVLRELQAGGLAVTARIRFSSEVSRYDSQPLFALQRAATCAS